MRAKMIVRLAVAAALVTGAACAASAAATAPKTSPAETGLRAAAKQKRYVFLTFYKRNDAASTKMLDEAKKLQAKHSDRANLVIADVGNAVHQGLVSRYGADRSPIPLTLVIAPNGAVTAGFPNAINKPDLSDAFVSTGMADVLKVLQDAKLAAVCLQNSKTKLNKESLAAAEGLKHGAQFRDVLDIVKVDPSDSAEAKLVQACRVDANTENAQLVVIAPPGRVVGTFDGTATAESIAAALTKALSGGTCGPGGGGGCCP